MSPRKPKTTQAHLCLCLDLRTTPPTVSTVGLYSSPAGSLPLVLGQSLWLDLGRFEGFDFEDARENAILTINNHMPWLHWTLPALTADPELSVTPASGEPVLPPSGKPAEEVLHEIRAVLWPPEDTEQEWDSETIEHVAAIVGREAADREAAGVDEDALMELSSRWPDSSTDLDELVNRYFDEQASSVNNDGTTEQIRFLVTQGGWTISDLAKVIDEEES